MEIHNRTVDVFSDGYGTRSGDLRIQTRLGKVV